MSLLSSLVKLGKKAVKTVISSPIGGAVLKAVPGLGTAATVASVASAVGGLGVKTARTAGRVIPGSGVTGKLATVGVATGAYQVGKSAGTPVMNQSGDVIMYRPKRRRMNYMNIKAAKRAGRRVAGAIRTLKKLEKSLPHRTVHSRARAR